jgi:hypothetical protein
MSNMTDKMVRWMTRGLGICATSKGADVNTTGLEMNQRGDGFLRDSITTRPDRDGEVAIRRR